MQAQGFLVVISLSLSLSPLYFVCRYLCLFLANLLEPLLWLLPITEENLGTSMMICYDGGGGSTGVGGVGGRGREGGGGGGGGEEEEDSVKLIILSNCLLKRYIMLILRRKL